MKTREWTINNNYNMNTEDDRKPTAAAAEEEDDSDVEIEGKFSHDIKMILHCKKLCVM